MEFEESIYNLIPKEAYVPPKQAKHVSKHDPKTAPTASTFGLRTTTQPNVSNMGGAPDLKQGGHKNTGNKAYWGEQTLAGHKVEKIPAQQTFTKKDPRALIPKDSSKFQPNS